MPDRHLPRSLTYLLVAFVASAVTWIRPVRAAEPGDGGVVPLISVEDMVSGTVRISGSGVLLDPEGFILTASHLVKDLDPRRETIKVRLFSPNAPSVPAELKDCAHNNADACIIKIRSEDVVAAHVTNFPDLACRRMIDDEEVTAVGWPSGGVMGLDRPKGTVTGGLPKVGVLYPTTALALHGMSGGPVYDKSGLVVGLVRGGITEGQRVFFSPLFNIRELLSQSPGGCTPKPASFPPAVVEGTKAWSDLPARFRTWHAAPGDRRSKLDALAANGDLTLRNGSLALPATGTPRTLSARTLELDDGEIVTNGADLTIEVIDVVSDGGVVRSFPENSPPGRPGRSGGRVTLIVHGQVSGRISVDLKGQRGADGDPGAPGPTGAAGDPGDHGASSLFDCKRGPGNGARGGTGGTGIDGSPGQSGGAGGDLVVLTSDVPTTTEALQTDLSGGDGGQGGKGGPGGAGGPGGPPGGAPGHCRQTSHPGATGAAGPSGGLGPHGLRGKDGHRTIDPEELH